MAPHQVYEGNFFSKSQISLHQAVKKVLPGHLIQMNYKSMDLTHIRKKIPVEYDVSFQYNKN
jgi:hypothetical protein